MFFVVFGTSAKEMNHNDIWHELMICHFDHFVWALGSLFMFWSNWSKSNPREPEATGKCFVKQCEIVIVNCVKMCHACTFCTPPPPPPPPPHRFWDSTASKWLLVLPGMSRQMCEGLTYGRLLSRDSCDSGSQECGLFSASWAFMNFLYCIWFVFWVIFLIFQICSRNL